MAYDPVGRITGFSSTGDTTGFSYDANGNRTSSTRTVNGQTTRRSYGVGSASNQLIGFTQTTGISEVVFNLRFPVQYDDVESGLAQNWNRYYDKREGRYTQGDLIGLDGGWNRFDYANLNPLKYVDPLGLATLDFGSPATYDNGSSCKVVFPGGSVDDNGCVSTGGGPSICIGPAAIRGVVTEGAQAIATAFRTAHYASRLEAAGVTTARAEAAVAQDLNAMGRNLAPDADVAGRLTIDGVEVEYRARLLPNGTLNIGTIFPVK